MGGRKEGWRGGLDVCVCSCMDWCGILMVRSGAM